MASLAVVLISLFSLAVPLPARTEAPPDETWQTYIDSTYQVTLRFPGNWKKDPLYSDRPHFAEEKGPHKVWEGFFQLSLTGDSTLEHACKDAAEHVLQPYGRNPTIRPMEVDGQRGCVVWPSQDQPAPRHAELNIEYPEPVEVDGDLWSLLVLSADTDHILAIAQTLRFITAAHQDAPFLMEIAPQNATRAGTATWKKGAPISVIVTMKNNSHRVLHFGLTEPASGYRYSVIRSKRYQRVPAKNPAEEEHVSKKNVQITLKPQETCHDTVEVSSFVYLGRPGQYTIQLERDLPPELGKGVVRSNTITITVTE